MLEGEEHRAEGNKEGGGRWEWNNCNSIINKIYLFLKVLKFDTGGGRTVL